MEADPRGRGLRQALGELVPCSYCLAPGVAEMFLLALTYPLRPARLVAALINRVTLSDFWDQRYARLQQENQ